MIVGGSPEASEERLGAGEALREELGSEAAAEVAGLEAAVREGVATAKVGLVEAIVELVDMAGRREEEEE